MAGISDQVLKTNYAENKYRFNGGNEVQNKEFSDGSGIETYDALHRMYDPQLGRFGQIDPLSFFSRQFSPYKFANNNPIGLNDPLGLLSTADDPEVLATATVVGHRKSNDDNSFAGLFTRVVNIFKSTIEHSNEALAIPGVGEEEIAVELSLFADLDGDDLVFWSGGEDAMNAAMDYAKASGKTTLEMTRLEEL